MEQVNGYATAIIHTSLFTDTDAHRRNMCRILAIYFAEGEFGNKFSNMNISDKDKKTGFMKGIFAEITGQVPVLEFGKTPNNKLLWPAVFAVKPPGPLANVITLEACNAKTGQDRDVCDDKGYNKWFNENTAVKMTVLQWVTSPWHYLSLPYQEHRLLFEDGETYAEGCKRCSRPFYEYEYMYHWFLRSPEKTAHFVNSYWCISGDETATCDQSQAPKPFHHKQFWGTPTGVAVTKIL